jgi:leader peptidase (prepilin peptidase)/N-methyltransferase
MTAFDVAFRILLALPFGLVFGSFLTVAVYRLPRGESLVRPRSRCPSCGAPIGPLDNVPLISWVVLRGRCRACGVHIPALYPLLELASGVLFVAVALTFDDPWTAALLAPFLALLLAISVIDFRTKKIPNRLVYPSHLVAAAAIVVADLAGSELDAIRAGIGFLAYGIGLLAIALISPRGMGMGDVKLAALIGLVLGALGLRYVAVAAAVGVAIGGVASLIALLAGIGRKARIPFGPFLAAGAAVAAFAGGLIAEAYLDLLR